MMSTLFTEKQFNTILKNINFTYTEHCVRINFDNDFFYLDTMYSVLKKELYNVMFFVNKNAVDLSEKQQNALLEMVKDFHEKETFLRV